MESLNTVFFIWTDSTLIKIDFLICEDVWLKQIFVFKLYCILQQAQQAQGAGSPSQFTQQPGNTMNVGQNMSNPQMVRQATSQHSLVGHFCSGLNILIDYIYWSSIHICARLIFSMQRKWEKHWCYMTNVNMFISLYILLLLIILMYSM